MVEIDLNLNLYKTPSDEILGHRKEFYGLWKRCDDDAAMWLKRVQRQYDRCEFPQLISRDFLFIDKFVCELNDDEREFIRKANIWTLIELNEYLANQRKESIGSLEVNATGTVNKTIRYKQQIQSSSLPSTVAIKNEFDGYEYTQNVADIENANEEFPFIDIKLEPNSLALENEPMADSSNDIANSDLFSFGAAQSEPDSDGINETLNDEIDFESEDYRISKNDIVANVAELDAVAAKKDEGDDTNQANLPLENESKHKHKTDSTKRKQYACDQCDKSFVKLSSMNTHKMKIHGVIRSHECKQCDMAFYEKSSLKTHKKNIHRKIREKSHACQICDKRFTSKGGLTGHMRTHTGEKPYACDQCNKSFNQRGNLYHHKQVVHQGVRPHACHKCDKRFGMKFQLEDHLHTHTGQKPYVCDQCAKSYACAASLFNHNTFFHQKLRPYCCDICDKRFVTHSRIKTHMQAHTGKKPYSCDICKKSFKTKTTVKSHKMAVHDAIRSHECNLCNRAFTRRGQLKTHKENFHQGIRPYACQICDKRFSLKATLKNHLRTHTGEKPHACDRCDRSFADIRDLKRHKLNCH